MKKGPHNGCFTIDGVLCRNERAAHLEYPRIPRHVYHKKWRKRKTILGIHDSDQVAPHQAVAPFSKLKTEWPSAWCLWTLT